MNGLGYNTMSNMTDMSMVWMGSQQGVEETRSISFMNHDNTEMLIDSQENIYYTPSRHSISSQSMDDIQSTLHSSQMDTVESYDMMQFMDLKHDSNDSNYLDDENSQPVYMITTSTQTLPCTTRKIKPIKHPGLVLKTPIAYQGNTDPAVIPIQKDGIAVCEKCGAIGVKHAFYTRERRFCSMACARGYNGLLPETMPPTNPDNPELLVQYAKHNFTSKLDDDFQDTYAIDPKLPQIAKAQYSPIDDSLPLVKRKPSELANSFSWDSQLMDRYFVAASVTCFKHAPMADIWENIMVGMKVEVENTDCDNASDAFPDSFWVAHVIRIVGYKALLRYEGFGVNDSKDFWVSLCSNQVHAVGWCATRGKPLIPPKTIEDKYSDWKDFLRKRLTGARTLPSNFSNKASESLKSRFDVGLMLEVVDKNCISRVKVAIIQNIVGKRLNVKYYDMPLEDPGFWCHEDSPLLHPVGWSKRVGHRLVAPINYLERITQGIFDDDDATDELFNPIQVGSPDYNNSGFSVGMKLEAIDPLNLSCICAATVMDVLNFGYIMIRIDRYDADIITSGVDWFCYHIKSPCIFPVGFCKSHNIPLTPPVNYDAATFDWNKYLLETANTPVKNNCFNTYVPLHGFVPGMKIEAADLMDPRLVCVATVAKVVGRLLKVHFDGWNDEYDQWLDCESPDIYPVGWCQSVGHKLEGPPNYVKANLQTVKSNKMKKKGKKKKSKEFAKNSAFEQMSGSSSTSQSMKNLKEVQRNEEPELEDDHSVGNFDGRSEFSEDNHEAECTSKSQESISSELTLPVASNNDVYVSSVNTNSEPPLERKPSTYTSLISNPKLIPRLVDNSCSNNDPSAELCPDEWNVFDVAQFLRVNDCANYCDAFSKQKVNGKMLLNLDKEDILEYTGGKVGPSLKIFDLIQQLKNKFHSLRHVNLKKYV